MHLKAETLPVRGRGLLFYRIYAILYLKSNCTRNELILLNRIPALSAILREEDADAMLLTGEVNLTYITQMTGLEGQCLILPDDTAIFVTDGRYTEAAEQKLIPRGFTVLTRSNMSAMYDYLRSVLEQHDIRRLMYEDDSIQHAGVVIGFGGIAGHTFIGLHEVQNSYFHRAVTAQDYSAVTAACMMIRAELFRQVGGFTEELAVAFNDIDLCLKVRETGALVVYNPYALFHHYESKSRGLEDTPEKVERFNREIAGFMKRWPEILEKGDPYYNPNLTLRKSNFALRDLDKEKIGEPYHIEGIEKYL